MATYGVSNWGCLDVDGDDCYNGDVDVMLVVV